MSLVLHADDLGLNHAVTDGVLRGFRQGLLTSTSLLANAPDAARAVSLWKDLIADQAAGRLPSAAVRRQLGDPSAPFDLGVHLNLTQGRPLDGDRYPAELLDAEGRFPGVFSLFARLRRSGDKFREAIADQWRRQIRFLVDHGVRPTHFNGHQYVEMLPIAAAILPELMAEFGIRSVRIALEPRLFRNTAMNRGQIWKWPLARVKRAFAARLQAVADARGLSHTGAFYGTVYAGGVDLRLLKRFLAGSPTHRLVEIALHPGEAASEPSAEDRAAGWRDPLAAARPGELQMLVSDDLPRYLESAGWHLGRLAADK